MYLGGENMVLVVVLFVITLLVGLDTVMSLDNSISIYFKIIIMLQLLLCTLVAYCGMRLKEIRDKKQKAPQSVIPESEARKAFRYLYVDSNSINDDEMRDAIEWIFNKRGYQVVADVKNLSADNQKKLIFVNVEIEKDDKSLNCVTIYGKNTDGQLVFSTTKKNSSLSMAREEAFEALKQ